MRRKSSLSKHSQYTLNIAVSYLDYATKLFRKKHASISQGQINLQPHVACERHLNQRHKQSTIAAVVIRQQLPFSIQRLHRLEERRQHRRLRHIGSLITNLPIHLRQARSPQPRLATSKIDQHQRICTRLQLRRKRPTHIRHRSKARNDQRQRRHHTLRSFAIAPLHPHRHRIFANRYRHPKRWAKLHPNRLHSFKQLLILVSFASRSHPVRRKLDVRKLLNRGTGHVGNHFPNRHPCGSRSINHRQRRTLTHRHRFTAHRIERRQRHSTVRNRHLPRPNHLLLHYHAAHTAIANRNQKRLRRNRRQPQQTLHSIRNRHAAKIQCNSNWLHRIERPLHLRRLPKQYL